MMSRRRVITLNNPVDPTLREAIAKAVRADVCQKIEGDIPLVEAALVTDRRIISLDDTDRNHFRCVAQSGVDGTEPLRDLLWVNPNETRCEDVPKWLEAGAPDEPHRRLGHSQGQLP